MLFTAVFTVTSSTPAPAYEISDTRVEKGGSFSLVISLKDNPGIISLRFKIEYDESALRLDSIEDLALLEGLSTPSPTMSSPYILRWSVSTADNSSASGELVKLNFTAVSETETTTEIKIAHVEANTSAGGKVTFADDSALVEIKEKYSVKFVDGDGETVISEQKYFIDEKVTLPEDPTKPSDGENKYIFTGWTPEVTETVMQDTVYTAIYETVALSDDSTLASLSVDGSELSPTFDPSVKEYSLTVGNSMSKLEPIYETANEFATVSVEEHILRVGVNTVKITVTAEKGNVSEYILTVTKEENPNYKEDNNSTLKEIIFSGGVLSPAFDPARTQYILYVENSLDEIEISCLPSSEKAESFSEPTTVSLASGSAELTLSCVAESGHKTEYFFRIVKLPPYRDGELPGFIYPSDIPPADDGGETGNAPAPAPVPPKKLQLSKTTVIIVTALAAVLAVSAIVGIIFLAVSNKKTAKKM